MHSDTQITLIERFVGHLAAGTTDAAPHNLRVPASHYVDDEQNAKEVAVLFRQRPQLIALTPELPHVGDFVARELLDTSLLLVRDEQGIAHAYINACRHRGVRLAEGRGSKRSFSCPFHAWNWRLDGTLISRPNSCGGFEGLEADFDTLLQLPCHEVAGMIFVLLEGDNIAAAVTQLLGPALRDLENYRIADTVYFDERTTEKDCNYKFIMDGFSESYHLSVLHKATIAPYYYSSPSLTDVMGDTVRMIGVRRSIDAEFEKPAAEQRLLPHGTTQYLISPNVVLTHQVDHIQFWRIYPVDGAQRCRATLSVFWPAPMDAEAQRKSQFNLDILWQVTTEEDIPQSLMIHKNLASGALPAVVFGTNEPALVHYHVSVAQAIGSDTVTVVS